MRNEGVSNANNGHHEAIFADWFDIISNQLQEDFPNLSEADANALTWGGLGDTNQWAEMNEEDIENNTGITGGIPKPEVREQMYRISRTFGKIVNSQIKKLIEEI